MATIGTTYRSICEYVTVSQVYRRDDNLASTDHSPSSSMPCSPPRRSDRASPLAHLSRIACSYDHRRPCSLVHLDHAQRELRRVSCRLADSWPSYQHRQCPDRLRGPIDTFWRSCQSTVIRPSTHSVINQNEVCTQCENPASSRVPACDFGDLHMMSCGEPHLQSSNTDDYVRESCWAGAGPLPRSHSITRSEWHWWRGRHDCYLFADLKSVDRCRAWRKVVDSTEATPRDAKSPWKNGTSGRRPLSRIDQRCEWDALL